MLKVQDDTDLVVDSGNSDAAGQEGNNEQSSGQANGQAGVSASANQRDVIIAAPRDSQIVFKDQTDQNLTDPEPAAEEEDVSGEELAGMLDELVLKRKQELQDAGKTSISSTPTSGQSLGKSLPTPEQTHQELGQISTAAVDEALGDLDANEEQLAFIKSSLLLYMQDRIDIHLQEILPEELFTKLDEMLDTQEIKPEEVFGFVVVAYEAVVKQPITVYARNLLADIVPQFKAIFKEGQRALDRLEALSPENQEKFKAALREADFDAAEEVLQG